MYVSFLPARRSKRRLCYGNVAGWVAGWVSVNARIVTKRLNLSKNFFDHLKAASFYFFETPAPIQVPRGTPSAGALNTWGGKNW